ncbi:MAG: LytS/YhcK type 5TM receptor domain-containing protein, partial [Tumebacillaceae bacterium]
MIGIKDLLLNILFLLVPIFVYQTFWGDKAESVSITPRHRSVIAVLSSISLILCMTFPVTYIPGYLLDLRLVPLLLAILYGGYGVGLIVTVSMFAYRIYIGGADPGFYYMLATFPVIILAAFYFVSRFGRYGRKGKTTLISLLILPQLIGT